jgi:hypothetical protein
MNSIMVLTPYRYNGLWVFDDKNTGLVREALIAGVPEILEALHKEHKIVNPDNGFNLLFSPAPFPGYHTEANWLREGDGGNWYQATLPSGEVQEGWLCPALFKYFPEAPKKIYFKVESLPNSFVLGAG